MSTDYDDRDADLEDIANDYAGLPPAWDDWDINQRADWLARRNSRLGLLCKVLDIHDLEPTYQNDKGEKERLTKEELAKICIRNGGVK
jgi:hypothetical protein